MNTDNTFKKGEVVVHKGEGIKGEISGFHNGKVKVQWNDGHETIETFHTIERVDYE